MAHCCWLGLCTQKHYPQDPWDWYSYIPTCGWSFYGKLDRWIYHSHWSIVGSQWVSLWIYFRIWSSKSNMDCLIFQKWNYPCNNLTLKTRNHWPQVTWSIHHRLVRRQCDYWAPEIHQHLGWFRGRLGIQVRLTWHGRWKLEKLHQETSSDILGGEWLGKTPTEPRKACKISTLRVRYLMKLQKKRKKSLGID